MKSKVTNLLELEKIQVDLKKQNMDLRKNQEPEKMENRLIQCSKCDSIFYYQTVCYCSKPMSRKITENPHLEKFDDFCDDSTATHYLNHFFDSCPIEILS